MASYTMTVQSNELEAKYGRDYVYSSFSNWNDTTEGKFTFNIQGLLGTVIKSVSITAPVEYTAQCGGYGNYELKLDSSSLGIWRDSDTTTWSASDLSLAGKSSNTLTLDLGPSNNYHTYTSSTGSTIGKTGRRLGRATATITYEAEFRISTVSPLSGSNIASSLANTFTWSQTLFAGTMASQTLYWKNHSDANYNMISVGANDTSYTFNANSFSNIYIDWVVQGTDSFGNSVYSNVETVKVGIVPTVAVSYPKNVNITNSDTQVFTWEMSESVPTGQKSYTIRYRKTNESQWTQVSNQSSNQYHQFAANTFDTSNYVWHIVVENKDGNYVQSSNALFTAIGSTSAPNITSVTNAAMPKITWTISSQDTFELEIYKDEERLYSSGVRVGYNVRTFTPNIILSDGNYIVKMRAMNEYGYMTEWSERSFVLSTQKPSSISCSVYANLYHGVNVELSSGTSSNLYVLRRVFGDEKWDILGKLQDSESIFTDNTLIKNIKYEYALRSLNKTAGFIDSDIKEMVIDYNGLILYNGNEFVQLYMTEDGQFDISHTPSKSYSDSYTIGRKYPIRESSEWLAHTTSLSCFVTFEEYQKLIEFFEGDNLLWFKGKDFSFRCAIDSINIKETLLGKGYTLNISLSRMDEDEVIL